MSHAKRQLTSDDLLRISEQHSQKKRKLDFEEDDNDSHSDGFASNSESESLHGNLSWEQFSRLTHPSLAPAAHPPKTAIDFAALGVSKPLQSALASMSIHTPTDIQAACIPPLLSGRDCIGNAKTGSGKTVAFAIPILQQLFLDPFGIFALVLTPTRELAFQIAEQFAVLGSQVNIRTAVIVGGMDSISQAIELKNKPHIVIATPGRLVDLLRSSASEWDLSRLKVLILDEADRLLTPTFTEDLSFLFDALPKNRQTGLFTATYTPALESIANAPTRPGKLKPVIHRINESVETVATLKQYFLLVPPHVRECYLFYLLSNPPEFIADLRREPPTTTRAVKKGRSKIKANSASASQETQQPPPTIIFCRKPRTVAYLTCLLKELGIRSTPLHSRLTQRERMASLGLFRSSMVPVLVSTDVGARGLDIDDVALVVNWELPDEPEEYTHRVGRTARVGRSGVAVSFVGGRDEDRLAKVERRINTTLEEMQLPESSVLAKLNLVSTAKRVATMELHDSQFGKREEINKAKNASRK